MSSASLRLWAILSGALALAGCDDFDLRDSVGGFDTSRAASVASTPRPEPDARGVISYPGYQVAVAERGDTLHAMAERLGLNAAELARFNGIAADDPLRMGEIIALPTRVAVVSDDFDLAQIAGAAIDASPEDPARPAPVISAEPLAPVGPEPVRHKVTRGETAFTIARLYNVPVSSLAEWNALDADFSLREGQFLLIPTGAQRQSAASVAAPGLGSATPTPPSSRTAVPSEDATPAEQVAAAPAPAAPPVAAPEDRSEFLTPVAGTVIRSYAKGRNEGVDFAAPGGTRVNAAADGTVAAVTQDTNGVSILVLRHDGDLLTVYTQIDNLAVEKGDLVRRGQKIAEVRASETSYLHFEVRSGLESVNPANYLDL